MHLGASMTSQQSPIKLVTRTRNKWKKTGKQRSASDNAAALGYIIWQMALSGAKKLHLEDFRYDDDDQRVRVIEEYLAFLVHIADRLSFGTLEPDERLNFISNVARACARHLQRNKEEIIGDGDHEAVFLDLVNRRTGEYGSCSFRGEPGYSMLRAIGAHIQNIMGTDQTNKWVIDQVMEIDASDLCNRLSGSLDSLIESS